MRRALVTLGILMVGCARSLPPLPLNPKTVDLFDGPEPVQGSLAAKTIEADRWNVMIEMTGHPPWSAQASAVGNMSSWVCTIPKLLLEWREGGPASSRSRTAFLTLHCNDPKQAAYLPGARQVYGQYLAHRLHEVSGLPALKTRLFDLEYRDDAIARPGRRQPALLLEAAWDTAARWDGNIRPAEASSREENDYRRLDPEITAYMALFQIMVGNEDWYAGGLSSLRMHLRESRDWDTVHNVFIIDRPPKASVPLAIDFDLSAVAGVAHYAAVLSGAAGTDELLRRVARAEFLDVVEAGTGWLEMQLFLWRRQFTPSARQAAAERLVSKRQAFVDSIDITGVPDAVKNNARRQIRRFFGVLTEPKERWVTGDTGGVLLDGPKGDVVCELPPSIPVGVLSTPTEGSVEIQVWQRVRLDTAPPSPLCALVGKSIWRVWIAAETLVASNGAPLWSW